MDDAEDPKIIQSRFYATEEEGFVVLPVDSKRFKQFVQSLLGSPQSINKLIEGPFEITVDDIRNLYQLILQRVTQQNKGVLAQFTAKIVFSDNSSVELKSIADFVTYNEVRAISVIDLHLTWDFVVTFPDKEYPEKQQIQVSFVTFGQKIRRTFLDPDLPLTMYSALLGRNGFIQFRIEHTARTWGADIAALLSDHMESFKRSTTNYKEFARRHSGKISTGVFSLFVALILVGAIVSSREFANSQIATIGSIIADSVPPDFNVINSKLNTIGQFMAQGDWAQFDVALIAFVLIGFVMALIFAVATDASIASSEPSFILLTRESFRQKEKTLAKLRHEWRAFLLTIVLSIVTSIMANLIFSYIFH